MVDTVLRKGYAGAQAGQGYLSDSNGMTEEERIAFEEQVNHINKSLAFGRSAGALELVFIGAITKARKAGRSAGYIKELTQLGRSAITLARQQEGPGKHYG